MTSLTPLDSEAGGGADGEAGRQLEDSVFAAGVGRLPVASAVMAASQSMPTMECRE
jgi:hypothetical protein